MDTVSNSQGGSVRTAADFLSPFEESALVLLRWGAVVATPEHRAQTEYLDWGLATMNPTVVFPSP
jgi:hypothetical protein